MNLELYKTFYQIARSGSILKASEQLYISQPAVSRAIRQLEHELGCSLFFRTSRGVRLTQQGQVLFEHIDRAFGFIATGEKKIAELQSLSAGEISIGVSDTLCKYYLIPYLKLFNTYHPAIRIHVTCPSTPGIIKLLKAGKIDFGIINMPLDDDQLSYKNIMEIQDCFVAGEKYRQLSYKVLSVRELVKYPLLLLERSSNTRIYIDEYFRQNSISVEPAFELGNIDLLMQFARYDFGLACVIRNFVEDELDEGRFYEIKLAEKIPPRSICAVWLKEVPLSAAAREMIGCLDSPDIPEI